MCTVHRLTRCRNSSVQTSSYSAEFGRAGGAVLNASIKSGTRSAPWKSCSNSTATPSSTRTTSSTRYQGQDKGEFIRNQFGGTLGGPLRFLQRGDTRRTFFFVDYEGTIAEAGAALPDQHPYCIDAPKQLHELLRAPRRRAARARTGWDACSRWERSWIPRQRASFQRARSIQ